MGDNSCTAREYQQNIADNLGCKKHIIWDLLSSKQGYVLKKKITQVIHDTETGQNDILKRRALIFKNIWAENKHFDSTDCCMIFVDEFGRVYQRWQSFIDENDFEAGTMVVPKNGIYFVDDDGDVILETHETPAASVLNKVMVCADKGSEVCGLISAIATVTSIVLLPVAAPVIAPVAAASTAVEVVTTLYTILRSANKLIDRSNHEQSINLMDSEARREWLGIACGAIAVGASSATKLMEKAAIAGKKIPSVAKSAVNTMNVSSIVISHANIANGAVDLVLKTVDNEEIASMDVVQLSLSLVCLTHSVQNFSLASEIVRGARNEYIKSYRSTLKKHQRKMFDKLVKETKRINGSKRGKIDIIRSINEIPSPKYLSDLFKINKTLKQNNIRPSFGGTGRPIVLNGELPVDTRALRSSLQQNIAPNKLKLVAQPIPPSHRESNGSLTRQSTINGSIEPVIRDFVNNPLGICLEMKVATIILGIEILDRISNADSFNDVINIMADKLPKDLYEYLLALVRHFVDRYLHEIESRLNTFISAETVLYQLMTNWLEYYSDLSLEKLMEKEDKILEKLKDYFVSCNPNNTRNRYIKCNYCDYGYTICDLP